MCSVILGQLESSRNFKGFMHQSIPAAPSPFPGLPRGNCPPCQSWGWRICQPRGQPRAFDTHAVSYPNITTQRILLENKQIGSFVKDRMGKNWRGLWRHVLDFVHAFLHCLSSQNFIAKLGNYRGESTFFWLLNQVSLDIIWRTSFHIYKTIRSS